MADGTEASLGLSLTGYLRATKKTIRVKVPVMDHHNHDILLGIDILTSLQMEMTLNGIKILPRHQTCTITGPIKMADLPPDKRKTAEDNCAVFQRLKELHR